MLTARKIREITAIIVEVKRAQDMVSGLDFAIMDESSALSEEEYAHHAEGLDSASGDLSSACECIQDALENLQSVIASIDASDSELAEALDAYTDPKSDQYDAAFHVKIRALRPDWF